MTSQAVLNRDGDEGTVGDAAMLMHRADSLVRGRGSEGGRGGGWACMWVAPIVVICLASVGASGQSCEMRFVEIGVIWLCPCGADSEIDALPIIACRVMYV